MKNPIHRKTRLSASVFDTTSKTHKTAGISAFALAIYLAECLKSTYAGQGAVAALVPVTESETLKSLEQSVLTEQEAIEAIIVELAAKQKEADGLSADESMDVVASYESHMTPAMESQTGASGASVLVGGTAVTEEASTTSPAWLGFGLIVLGSGIAVATTGSGGFSTDDEGEQDEDYDEDATTSDTNLEDSEDDVSVESKGDAALQSILQMFFGGQISHGGEFSLEEVDQLSEKYYQATISELLNGLDMTSGYLTASYLPLFENHSEYLTYMGFDLETNDDLISFIRLANEQYLNVTSNDQNPTSFFLYFDGFINQYIHQKVVEDAYSISPDFNAGEVVIKYEMLWREELVDEVEITSVQLLDATTNQPSDYFVLNTGNDIEMLFDADTLLDVEYLNIIAKINDIEVEKLISIGNSVKVAPTSFVNSHSTIYIDSLIQTQSFYPEEDWMGIDVSVLMSADPEGESLIMPSEDPYIPESAGIYVNEQMREVVFDAFQNILKFTNTLARFSNDNDQNAEIRVSFYDCENPGPFAIAEAYGMGTFPDPIDVQGSGELSMNVCELEPSSFYPGSLSYMVLIHEIGHTLGLAHTHDLGGGSLFFPEVTVPRGDFGWFDLNSNLFSMMSYNSFFAGNNGQLRFSFSDFDIDMSGSLGVTEVLALIEALSPGALSDDPELVSLVDDPLAQAIKYFELRNIDTSLMENEVVSQPEFDVIVSMANGIEEYGMLTSPMGFDVTALQWTYGVSQTLNSGDTTYTLPYENAAGTGWSAIFDVSGIDTIQAPEEATTNDSVVIDLRNATLNMEDYGGGFISRMTKEDQDILGGFTIAFDWDGGFLTGPGWESGGNIIENAQGSPGNDVFYVNHVPHCRADAEDYANHIEGGGGDDTAVFAFTYSDYVVEHLDQVLKVTRLDSNGFMTKDIDTLENIEYIQFSDKKYLVETKQFVDTPSNEESAEYNANSVFVTYDYENAFDYYGDISADLVTSFFVLGYNSDENEFEIFSDDIQEIYGNESLPMNFVETGHDLYLAYAVSNDIKLEYDKFESLHNTITDGCNTPLPQDTPSLDIPTILDSENLGAISTTLIEALGDDESEFDVSEFDWELYTDITDLVNADIWA